MPHNFAYALGLIFYLFLFWVLLQMTLASWKHRWATAKWTAFVNTRLLRRLGIKWLSLIITIAVALQILLVVFMLGVSFYTGKPITFPQTR